MAETCKILRDPPHINKIKKRMNLSLFMKKMRRNILLEQECCNNVFRIKQN